jgi:hypothetical protein
LVTTLALRLAAVTPATENPTVLHGLIAQ